VAIARALVMQPRILILDDAMSAVDTETEHQIREALSELMQGRTTFIIAQRLLTLKRADLILVLDGGRIVERGSHAQLLAAGGLYARIYDLQLKDQETLAAEAREEGRS
jgi:ATP-binding cassette subfamily B protein